MVNLTEKEGKSMYIQLHYFPFLHFFKLIEGKFTILNQKKSLEETLEGHLVHFYNHRQF